MDEDIAANCAGLTGDDLKMCKKPYKSARKAAVETCKQIQPPPLPTPGPEPPTPDGECVNFDPATMGIDAFNTLQLDKHNAFRAHHNTDSLEWDAHLTDLAYAYACRLSTEFLDRNGARLVHDTDYLYEHGMGENLGWVWGPTEENLVSGETNVTDAWYAEIVDYDFNTESSTGGAVGHFTQMVWKATSKIGCGWAGKPGYETN